MVRYPNDSNILSSNDMEASVPTVALIQQPQERRPVHPTLYSKARYDVGIPTFACQSRSGNHPNARKRRDHPPRHVTFVGTLILKMILEQVSCPSRLYHTTLVTATLTLIKTILRCAAADDDADGASSVDELYQGYGTHYVDLWIGTPNPQRQTLIVDTGTPSLPFLARHVLAPAVVRATTPIRITGNRNRKPFALYPAVIVPLDTAALLANVRDCTISVSYQEGSSWRAFEASDLVYSGGPHSHAITTNSFRMHFGCQTKVTGLFKTQLACGIMGMEMAGSSFWKQMYKEGALQEKMFALCLSRQPTASREGTGAGAMTWEASIRDCTRPKWYMPIKCTATNGLWYDSSTCFFVCNGGERVQDRHPLARMQDAGCVGRRTEWQWHDYSRQWHD